MKMLFSAVLTGALAAVLSPPVAAQSAATLVDVVRQSTERFLNISRAIDAGYGRLLGCANGPDQGSMGIHYANGALVADGTLDARHPEALLYEPLADGRKRLLGVEFVVIAEAWDSVNPAPPVLRGQLFHYEGSPNRYGLPPFYALHVWAWKPNPKGMFADWNPDVTCVHYAG
jgi:hypothetical protein